MIKIFILNHCGITVCSLDSSPTLAKSSQLPALMEAQKRKLEEDTQQLERLRMAKEKQFQTYYQVGVFLNCALIHVHFQHLLIYNFCCRIIIL